MLPVRGAGRDDLRQCRRRRRRLGCPRRSSRTQSRIYQLYAALHAGFSSPLCDIPMRGASVAYPPTSPACTSLRRVAPGPRAGAVTKPANAASILSPYREPQKRSLDEEDGWTRRCRVTLGSLGREKSRECRGRHVRRETRGFPSSLYNSDRVFSSKRGLSSASLWHNFGIY